MKTYKTERITSRPKFDTIVLNTKKCKKCANLCAEKCKKCENCIIAMI